MTPPNEPREPVPVLPPEHTASFMENVVIRPAPVPGWVDLVQLRNDAPTRLRAASQGMTLDEMKLQRDGHLEYGKVRSRDHAWVRSLHQVVEVTPTHVFTTLGDGRGVIAWKREP